MPYVAGAVLVGFLASVLMAVYTDTCSASE